MKGVLSRKGRWGIAAVSVGLVIAADGALLGQGGGVRAAQLPGLEGVADVELVCLEPRTGAPAIVFTQLIDGYYGVYYEMRKHGEYVSSGFTRNKGEKLEAPLTVAEVASGTMEIIALELLNRPVLETGRELGRGTLVTECGSVTTTAPSTSLPPTPTTAIPPAPTTTRPQAGQPAVTTTVRPRTSPTVSPPSRQRPKDESRRRSARKVFLCGRWIGWCS